MQKKMLVAGILIVALSGSFIGCSSPPQDVNAKIPVMDTNPDVTVKIPVMDASQDTAASDTVANDAATSDTTSSNTVDIVDTTASQSTESVQLKPEEAKKIALEDAGLLEADVTFQTIEYEYDDGIAYYEVDFYSRAAGKSDKYEYDISADNGRIISYSSKPMNTEAAAADIVTEAEVERIVKERAGITEAIKIPFYLKQDDGRMVYEGEFVYKEYTYEFEVDAVTGTITDWDFESVYDD